MRVANFKLCYVFQVGKKIYTLKIYYRTMHVRNIFIKMIQITSYE